MSGWMKNYQLGDVRRMATSADGSLEGVLEARRELARRGRKVPALPAGLALYTQLAGGNVVHVGSPALCGTNGEALGETVADERAITVNRRPVCGRCIPLRDRALALRTDRSNVPNPETDDAGETGEKEAPMATATKTASKDLLDVKKYATASDKKLVEERTTVNNRISGVKTQLKRLAGQRGVAERKQELQKRLDDLTNRRQMIGDQLASRAAAKGSSNGGNPKLAAATKEVAGTLAAKSRAGAKKSGTARRK